MYDNASDGTELRESPRSCESTVPVDMAHVDAKKVGRISRMRWLAGLRAGFEPRQGHQLTAPRAKPSCTPQPMATPIDLSGGIVKREVPDSCKASESSLCLRALVSEGLPDCLPN